MRKPPPQRPGRAPAGPSVGDERAQVGGIWTRLLRCLSSGSHLPTGPGMWCGLVPAATKRYTALPCPGLHGRAVCA